MFENSGWGFPVMPLLFIKTIDNSYYSYLVLDFCAKIFYLLRLLSLSNCSDKKNEPRMTHEPSLN